MHSSSEQGWVDAMAKLLGQVTKKYREQNHLSLRALARRSGVAKSYLARLESGDGKTGRIPEPSIDTVRALADAMGMDRIKLFKTLGMEVDIADSPAQKIEAVKVTPFAYIPLNRSNLEAALPERRLLILPFTPPNMGDFVYLPYYEMGGMVLALTVKHVSGGVYSAWHEAVGDVEFNLFDIDRTVFVSRSAAYAKLDEWKRAQ